MGGATGVLAVNIGVACLFAGGYAVLAFANPSQRAALWFAVSYLIGMLSPIADLLAPYVARPEVTEWLGYTALLVATLSISAAFCRFNGRRPPWLAIAGLLVLGLALRLSIGTRLRDDLLYGMAYQLPFTGAAILAMRTVLTTRRGPLHLALAGVFGVIALNFLTKPFFAQAFGSGLTLANYTRTTYALISQASTGILLLAAGLVLLLIVAQKAITESQQASETDPLTGVANRRGFDRLANEAIARAGQAGRPAVAIVFDLDHFKRINDTHGHAAGDAVIAAFAASLRAAFPRAASIGRMGGEEFAVLLDDAGLQAGWRDAEVLRQRVRDAEHPDLPAFTVSGGVAELRPGESLAELMRRADQASYAAKNGGRDRVCLAPVEAPDDPKVASLDRTRRSRTGR